jgi:hypothetical protein
LFLFYSELKRRLKLEQKAKEKAEKEKEKSKSQPENVKSTKEKPAVNEEDVSPNVS